jgi:histidine phosphotransferase ChpT
VTGDAEKPDFDLLATGSHSRIPVGLVALLAGEPENGVLDSHHIQPYYTGLIARAAGMNVALEALEGSVSIKSTPATATVL